MVREIRSLRRARRLAGLLCAVWRSRPRWKDGARLYLISQTVISRPLRPARMCGPAGSDQVARQVRGVELVPPTCTSPARLGRIWACGGRREST